MSRLTLRARLILLTAVAVAVAVAGCAVASWYLARERLYDQLDRSLRNSGPGPGVAPGAAPPRRDGGIDPIDQAISECSQEPTVSGFPSWGRFTTQIVLADGRRCTIPNSYALVVTPADVRVATRQSKAVFHDGVTTTGVAMRVHTRWDGLHEVAISVAAPLRETQETLDSLALWLVMVSALGIVAAGTAGLLIARSVLRPVDRLTATVEHIARTEDLNTVIPVEGKDEIARLSHTFNTMTTALARSKEHQQQLIADAGHELRTPLTSLRTNVDLLLRSESTGRDLPPETRSRLLATTKAQMIELTSLVGDLLELARPDEGDKPSQLVGLHDVVGHAVDRARLRGPGLVIDADLEPWFVHGDPGSLERAVVNLLDNAVKFSPPGGTIEVRLTGGELTVRDEGPGIPDHELPHVFERFWRSPSARSMPGSGLGLSIVARVVGEAGGAVRLESAADGGTVARLRLPGSAPGTATSRVPAEPLQPRQPPDPRR